MSQHPSTSPRVIHHTREALFFSDIHLGWVPCYEDHVLWLRHLPEAVGDADLIVMNGDIVDLSRGCHRKEERALIDDLKARVQRWRSEGRRVLYLEGNHDLMERAAPDFTPSDWMAEIRGHRGERILALHGHRFSDAPWSPTPYERLGKHLLRLENALYAQVPWILPFYGKTLGRGPDHIGQLESQAWARKLPGRIASLVQAGDQLVVGHTHFDRGYRDIAGVGVWRTGAWIQGGQASSANRMLRYHKGLFRRVGWDGNEWVACQASL